MLNYYWFSIINNGSYNYQCWEQFLLLIIFVELMNIISKERHLFKKTEIFCNIINLFTVTFNQFNASLLNKSIQVFLILKSYF